ncbi:hypothetical protein WN943_000248 [Citrus x changshan-huyou]
MGEAGKMPADSLTAAVTPGNTSDRPEHPEAATELYEWNRTSSIGSRNCQKDVRLSVYEALEALSPNLQKQVCQRHLAPWTPPFRTLKRRTNTERETREGKRPKIRVNLTK